MRAGSKSGIVRMLRLHSAPSNSQIDVVDLHVRCLSVMHVPTLATGCIEPPATCGPCRMPS